MILPEAIKSRHAVRSYLDKAIEPSIIARLEEEINLCNIEGKLNIQLVLNEPKAFGGRMAHYGKFSGVKNYIALAGTKANTPDEKLGYYGQRLALAAQMQGLNSCWVALTFSKGKCGAVLNKDEKLVCVITLGYGAVQGVPHRSRPMNALCKTEQNMPEWFKAGMEAAMLAPTAMNQQSFLLTQSGNTVNAKSTGGFYSRVDLGIVKYHFEIGAGKENFNWV